MDRPGGGRPGTIPVRFELADGSDAMFGTQPVDRTYNRPPSRDLYHEDLAPIWVTAPTRGQVLPADRVVTVGGEACVFEATVSWELLRDGDVVDEGFVTASVGAPGRGTYEIRLGSLVPGSYAVRVFELSAEDGHQGLGRDDDAVHGAVSPGRHPAAPGADVGGVVFAGQTDAARRRSTQDDDTLDDHDRRGTTRRRRDLLAHGPGVRRGSPAAGLRLVA